VQVSPDEFIYMHVAVYHSGHKVDEDFTSKAAAGPNPCWNELSRQKTSSPSQQEFDPHLNRQHLSPLGDSIATP